jgi:hypothetical protein
MLTPSSTASTAPAPDGPGGDAGCVDPGGFLSEKGGGTQAGSCAATARALSGC